MTMQFDDQSSVWVVQGRYMGRAFIAEGLSRNVAFARGIEIMRSIERRAA